MSDEDKAYVSELLTTEGSSLRTLFAQNTLDLHPNVQRIEAYMRSEDPEERAELRRQIVQVDVF